MAPFGASRAGLMSVVVDDIPDSDVYLHDDWGDNQLFSDREDGGTTTHNGVTGYYRPEWTEGQSGASVSNEALELSSGESVYFTDIGADLDETLTLEWELNDVSGFTSGTHQHGITILGDDIDPSQDVFHPNEGYVVKVIGNPDRVRVSRSQNYANDTVLISEEFDHGNLNDIRVTRDSDGNFELFINGNSQGTAQDTTYDTQSEVSIGAKNGGTTETNEVKWS